MSTSNQETSPEIICEDINYRNITVRFPTEIDSHEKHGDLLNVLYTAKQGDTINIYINCYGGDLYTTIQLCDAIQRCEAHVIGHLVGAGYSGGSMLFLACHSWTVSPLARMMIHNESGMDGWMKAHERKQANQFQDKYNPYMVETMYGGFLSEEEIQRVVDGHDIWLGSDEILERLDNLIKDRTEDCEEDTQEADAEVEEASE